jgi:hypothetical protein
MINVRNIEQADVVRMYDPDDIRNAILNLCTKEGLTITGIAAKAQVAPSTLTRFVNKTQGAKAIALGPTTTKKIADAFPNFLELMNIPQEKERLIPIYGRMEIIDVVPLRPGSIQSYSVNAGMFNADESVFGLIATNHQDGHFAHWVWVFDEDPLHIEKAVNSLTCLCNKNDAKQIFGYLSKNREGKYKIRGLTNIGKPRILEGEDWQAHPVLLAINPLITRANQLPGYQAEQE